MDSISEVRVKVELQDGSNTWICTFPVRHPHYTEAQKAAGEAFAVFIAVLEREKDAVDRRLAEAFAR